MTDPIKMKLLEELLNHLDSSQGMDLKSLVDKLKQPDPLADDAPGKPKGIQIESVKLIGKKPGMPGMDDADDLSKDAESEDSSMPVGGVSPIKDAMDSDASSGDSSDHDEMSDEELEELLKKLV